jgi:hypothetical protein
VGRSPDLQPEGEREVSGELPQRRRLKGHAAHRAVLNVEYRSKKDSAPLHYFAILCQYSHPPIALGLLLHCLSRPASFCEWSVSDLLCSEDVSLAMCIPRLEDLHLGWLAPCLPRT